MSHQESDPQGGPTSDQAEVDAIVADPARTPEQRFDGLAYLWIERTRLQPVDAVQAHPACKALIAMGRDVIPWVVRRIYRSPVWHWNLVLHPIAGDEFATWLAANPAYGQTLSENQRAWRDWYMDTWPQPSPTEEQVKSDVRAIVLDGSMTPEQRFQRLARMWTRHTGGLSSTSQKRFHPAFGAMVSMGMDAAPWIVQLIERNVLGHWWLVLEAIAKPAFDAWFGTRSGNYEHGINAYQRAWRDWWRETNVAKGGA